MLIHVETFLFNALVDTQAVQLLDTKEQGDTTGCSPEVDDQNTESLSTEESPAASVESTVRRRQQARHDGTQDTADTVY